jgi:hypothetical protein
MPKRLLAALLALLALAPQASATWSIVVINRATGEVAVASATCIPQTDLEIGLPVVRVGQGAGAIQSAGWSPGLVIMFETFESATPAEILAMVKAAAPNTGNLQIGIAGINGPAVTFTGGQAGKAKGGVTGELGDMSYAIQGNVLTGPEVWLDAEQAFLNTPGDLSKKIMASMEAAYAAGGDGRCSCDLFDPTRCGAPPPNFQKSAHVGFVIVARIGDQDPTCNNGDDCAKDGDYYLNINVANRNAKPGSEDPVLQLRTKYDNWRRGRRNKPDGLRSVVRSVQSLPADGAAQRTVTVELRDIASKKLTVGGHGVQVATVDGGPSLATLGPVVDNGDGTYAFTLTAGTQTGLDRFVVTAQAGGKVATLYPYLEVRSDAVTPLHCGYDRVAGATGLDVPFTLNVPGKPGGHYTVLGTLSGVSPGIRIGRMQVPLNPDAMTHWTLVNLSDPSVLSGMRGMLDASGRAEGTFSIPSGQLLSLSGLRFDWAGVVVGKGTPVATNAVGFDIVP